MTSHRSNYHSVGYDYFHSLYKEECKAEGKSPVSFKVYKKIVLGFLLKILRKVIYDNFTYTTPNKLGVLSLKARKIPPSNPIRKCKVIENQTKVINHYNASRYYYFFTVKWITDGLRFNNKSLYTFSITKPNKLEIYDNLVDVTNNPQKRLIIK